MSQLTVRFENLSLDELRDLLDFQGRELLVRQIAAMGEDVPPSVFDKMVELIGTEVLDEIKAMRDHLEGEEKPPQGQPQPRQPFDHREACAKAIEGRGPWAQSYATALRGMLDPSRGIKVLLAMLKDQRIESKYKNKQDPNSPVRLALGAAFDAQAKHFAQSRQWAEGEVRRLMDQFKACCAKENVAGMQDVMRRLRSHELHDVLVKQVGGTENRKHVLNAYQGAIDRAIQAIVQ